MNDIDRIPGDEFIPQPPLDAVDRIHPHAHPPDAVTGPRAMDRERQLARA
jgi:hypothetical protein